MAKSLLSKYQGADGGRRLIEALQNQPLVQERVLAAELARVVKPELIPAGQILIERGSRGKDLFLILSGTFAIKVHGQVISQPGPKQYDGEVGLLDPKGRRSAAVVKFQRSAQSNRL